MGRALEMYGLGHCSTCVKAREALSAAGWTVTFRDVRDEPLSAAEWQGLLDRFESRLVNRASLTWRAMTEDERAEPPIAQLTARPALMKRPLILGPDDQGTLGWTANVKRAYGVDA